ncbi:hypothetical protein KC331_g13930 [Hortaea werneckii]|uniref:Dolichyl-diphosphooligosaccharide--protein glycosyltransferase subunit 4 n=1 Tax=Hortaea werneckii TaxID=91943 RepID=A0A3M7BU59_HORWE|nr:hypothetical protein KC349_g7273 [Hortaea werneckii]KAI7531764.1 hypothetical protein KC331_g13930 [Hortaea werneckii]RMY43050.1 hypothetical protein D0865_11531 [Hortaea werneckii]
MTAAGESVALGNLSPLGLRLPSGPRPPKTATPITQERHPIHSTFPQHQLSITMISDASLYSLAIFLGSASMLMIVLYHFLEINAQDPKEPLTSERKADALPAKAR